MAQRLVRKVCTACEGKKTPSPCPQCLGSGFFGRHGMYELMRMSRALRQQIAKSPEAILLMDIAKTEGLQTLSEHGKELVKEGVTTAEEIWRVTRGGGD
jgi:type II secretory ATPase GspE/PulE/Tfp pilus assembly ATPase PilB-like protein